MSTLQSQPIVESPAPTIPPPGGLVAADSCLEALAKVPACLKELPNWVRWRMETRNGRPTKVPYQLDGRKAISTDSSTWNTFDRCVAGGPIGSTQGVGFALTGSGFTCVDLDHSVDPDTGELTPETQKIVRLFDSYTERSPNAGLHIWLLGSVPDDGPKRKGKYEAYSTDRYITITGQHLSGTPFCINERQTQLDQFIAEYMTKADKALKPDAPVAQRDSDSPRYTVSLSDVDVISTALRAKNGDAFQRLLAGQWQGAYPSASEADLAFCNMVCFYTKDAAQVDRLYRTSGLWRPKWDELHGSETYGAHTVSLAIRDTVNSYTPGWRADPHPAGVAAVTALMGPANSGTGRGHAKPDLLYFMHNDHGNACRLIALYRDEVRYCHAFKKWLVWDGTRWAVDDTDQAYRLAKQTILEFLRQAVDKGDVQAEKFAHSSLDAKRITNMLSMAECEICVRPAELDSDPNLLNFLNGTVDLRTGKMREHQQPDLITKLVHHRYRSEAQCPRWRAFLDQIMGGAQDAGRAQRLTSYLQRAFGYSLTGSTIEKAVFVLFGAGDNGKSTMLSTFRQLVDEYSMLLQVDTLMVRQESNNTQADLADLRGARFVQTSETEEGQRLAQGKLKRITQGMGKIKAVRKYENPIEFPETHKLWIDTNRKPMIRDADDAATFNRLHPIPFTVRIPKEQIDKELPAKLLAEAEGILAWAVEGARLRNESGLNKPPEVEAAKETWHAEVDQFGRFLEERCTVRDGFSVTASALYGNYKRWAEAGGEPPITARAFGLKMGERFTKIHGMYGYTYQGLKCETEMTE